MNHSIKNNPLSNATDMYKQNPSTCQSTSTCQTYVYSTTSRTEHGLWTFRCRHSCVHCMLIYTL